MARTTEVDKLAATVLRNLHCNMFRVNVLIFSVDIKLRKAMFAKFVSSATKTVNANSV